MKLFKDRIILYTVIFALISAVFVSTSGFAIPGFQSSFELGGNEARLYLKGVKYGNDIFLSKDDVLATGGTVAVWNDDTISIDIDGQPRAVSDPIGYPVYYEMSNLDGLRPDITFEILNDPVLVDYDGNLLGDGYTDVQVNSKGETVYIYRYAFDLSISCSADVVATDDIEGLYTQFHTLDAISIFYDGNALVVRDLSEIGVLDNIYAVLAVDLPTVDGWSFAWEGDVNIYPIKFESSVSGEEFTALDVYQHIEDEYPEVLHPVFEDYCFHYNINNNIQLSHSNNGRLMLNTVDNTNVSYIGADSISVPGAYKAWYAGAMYTDLQYKWDNYNPTIKYKITLEITATELSSSNVNEDNGDNNTDTTSTDTTGGGYWYTTDDTNPTTGGGGFDPLIGFDWSGVNDILGKVVIGGVVFIAVVGIVFVIRRKRAPEVYY